MTCEQPARPGAAGYIGPDALLLKDGVLVECAWCGAWLTEAGYRGCQPFLVMSLGGYRVSHGICPDCRRRVLAASGYQVAD